MGARQDRYQTPTAAELIDALPEVSAGLAREVVKSFRRKPKAVWVDPWGWSLVLEHSSGSAFLVTDPERPRLAARLPASMLDEDRLSGLPKAAREAVAAASLVGEAIWIEWALASQEVLDAVLPMIRQED